VEKNIDLKTIMNDWIHKAGMINLISLFLFSKVEGYPIVFACLGDDPGSVVIRQQHASLNEDLQTKVCNGFIYSSFIPY
jgi:hypothetical protein